MAASDIVASNALLDNRAESLRDRVQVDCSLRLFKNDFTPGPASLISDFSEASFNGYARKNMAGQWGEVLKEIDGRYTFVSAPQIFAGLAGAAGTIYGWFLVIGGKVQFSARLPVEWKSSPGRQLKVRISLQSNATSLPCCKKCGG